MCENKVCEKKIKVLSAPSENQPFAVIYKPSGLPSAPLKPYENSASVQCEELFPEIKNVCGKKEIEHGLLHRIDTDTQGILLLASTQKAYDFLCREQSEMNFIKTYKAKCVYCEDKSFLKEEGFPPLTLSEKLKIESFVSEPESKTLSLTLNSFFRPFGIKNKAVRPVTDESSAAALKKSGKIIYTTEILLTKGEKNSHFTAECRIAKGYRHQVRCHLSWAGFPIKGDSLYNFTDNEEEFYFVASGIKFRNPADGKWIEFSI